MCLLISWSPSISLFLYTVSLVPRMTWDDIKFLALVENNFKVGWTPTPLAMQSWWGLDCDPRCHTMIKSLFDKFLPLTCMLWSFLYPYLVGGQSRRWRKEADAVARICLGSPINRTGVCGKIQRIPGLHKWSQRRFFIPCDRFICQTFTNHRKEFLAPRSKTC